MRSGFAASRGHLSPCEVADDCNKWVRFPLNIKGTRTTGTKLLPHPVLNGARELLILEDPLAGAKAAKAEEALELTVAATDEELLSL